MTKALFQEDGRRQDRVKMAIRMNPGGTDRCARAPADGVDREFIAIAEGELIPLSLTGTHLLKRFPQDDAAE